MSAQVDGNDAHADVLVQSYYLRGVFDVFVGQLRHVHQSILMNTNIDKSSEIGDVGDDARQFHAFVQVFYSLYAAVKLKLLNLLAWVATRLFQFLHDIREGRESYLGSDILLDVNALARNFVQDKVADAATAVLRHLLHHVIALGVYGAVVEWILRLRDAQETGTLLEGGWSQTRHLLQLCPRRESTVRRAVVHDVLCEYGT